MGPEQAVGIIHRRRIADAPDPGAARERLAREYASEHLTAAAATREGFIDEVVAPSETRSRLAAALSALETGGPVAPAHPHLPPPPGAPTSTPAPPLPQAPAGPPSFAPRRAVTEARSA